jgi:multidrug transporter EmrE-like cation transporter
MLQNFLFLIIPILTLTAAQLFIKKGLLGLGEINFSFASLFHLFLRVFQSGWLVGGVILFGISFLLYLFVLSKIQLNIAYPIMVSVVIVLVAFFAWLLFKEILSWPQILGVVVIVFGIFLLAIKG